jgi:2-polyprenyl-3-methyl-5-hydroxy-6-metoxy-1,4-benzoquinol methylase
MSRKPRGGDSKLPSALDGLVTDALRHHQAGRVAEAEHGYRGVLAIDPNHADALHLLGVALSQRGQLGETLPLLQRALEIRPKYAAAAASLAHALLLSGRPEEAANAAARAVALAETPQTKALFTQAVAMSRDGKPLAAVRATIARAITERWARPQDLARIAADVVTSGGPLRVGTARNDPLLLVLMTAAPVCTLTLERELTAMRRTLLDAAVASEPVDARTLAFFCALARQCFLNEYVFGVSPDEAAQVERLIADAITKPTPLRLIAIAAYRPLHAIDKADALLTEKLSGVLAPLLAEQVSQPAQERSLRANIPQLTPISDEVSRAVQDQYEDNPYPRWSVTMEAPPAAAEPAFDALIAGCGTGRQAVELAQCHPAAKILAVDLSRMSLGYAMRRTRELGIANIEYAQADIMELGGIGRSFDLIEAVGVLHHLADPQAGWRVLLSLLRRGGRMRIGLYSELARRPVVVAHAFITQRGYGRTADDIRRFRQDVLGYETLAMLPQSRDFYTVSGCRDLLFHVQEHRMTLPGIKTFLMENNLAFQGFELDEGTLQAYRRRFPDTAMTDLDRWQVFETENPNTFVHMYNFTVTRP